MSSVAAQLILHPSASRIIDLLATTAGRDKIYRAVQYLSRFLTWYLIARGYTSEAARWNALKLHLATARKLLRIGKPLEHLQAALNATNNFQRPAEQTTMVLRQLSYAVYLFYDAIVWAHNAKFLDLSKESAQTVNRTSNRFWFYGIVFSICHDLLKAGQLANDAKSLSSLKWGGRSVGGEAERAVKLAAVDRDRAAVRYQFIIDLLDVWIPATSLGYANLNDGVLGIFGLVSSLMGLRAQWIAVSKMKTA